MRLEGGCERGCGGSGSPSSSQLPQSASCETEIGVTSG